MSVLNNITKCSCGLSYIWNSNLHSVNVQFVRFRKPRWVPTAKSKIYRVRQPTPVDPVEEEKMKQWTRHYNTALKSTRAFLQQYHMKLRAKQLGDIKRETLSWEEKFSMMTKRNKTWNKEVEKVRLRDQNEIEMMKSLRQQKIMERHVREREEMREKARQQILEIAKQSSEYITEENLDSEIEKLLNTRVSYEFAITPDGAIVGTEEMEEMEPDVHSKPNSSEPKDKPPLDS